MKHETHISKMRQDEYLAHFAGSIATYAREKVRAGQWAEEGALERAQAETDALLPQGIATPGHRFYTLRDESDNKVGVIWVTEREQGGRQIAWLTDVFIDAAFRRRGHARRGILAVQQQLAADGLPGMGLHVFGHNLGAQALYASLGYEVTNVNMFKAF